MKHKVKISILDENENEIMSAKIEPESIKDVMMHGGDVKPLFEVYKIMLEELERKNEEIST